MIPGKFPWEEKRRGVRYWGYWVHYWVIMALSILGVLLLVASFIVQLVYNQYRAIRYCRRCLGRGEYFDPTAPFDCMGSNEAIHSQRYRACPDCKYKVRYYNFILRN